MFESFDEFDEDVIRRVGPGNFVMNLLVDKLIPKPEPLDPISPAARRRAAQEVRFERMRYSDMFRSWLTEMLRAGAPGATLVNVKKEGLLGQKTLTAAGWLIYFYKITEGRSYGEFGYRQAPVHLLANGRWVDEGHLLKGLPDGYKRAIGPMTDIAVTHGLNWRPPNSQPSK